MREIKRYVYKGNVVRLLVGSGLEFKHTNLLYWWLDGTEWNEQKVLDDLPRVLARSLVESMVPEYQRIYYVLEVLDQPAENEWGTVSP